MLKYPMIRSRPNPNPKYLCPAALPPATRSTREGGGKSIRPVRPIPENRTREETRFPALMVAHLAMHCCRCCHGDERSPRTRKSRLAV